MYIKKILLAVALIGLVIFGYFAYYVYNAMFVDNTAFNNNEAYISVLINNAGIGSLTPLTETSLKDFKNQTGRRSNPWMTARANGLDEKDMQAIAAYLANIK